MADRECYMYLLYVVETVIVRGVSAGLCVFLMRHVHVSHGVSKVLALTTTGIGCWTGALAVRGLTEKHTLVWVMG